MVRSTPKGIRSDEYRAKQRRYEQIRRNHELREEILKRPHNNRVNEHDEDWWTLQKILVHENFYRQWDKAVQSDRDEANLAAQDHEYY